MVENYKKIWSIKKDLGLYLIGFDKNKSIKTKKYLDNYTIGEDKHWLLIVIIYNKYLFSTNNKMWKV